MQATARLKYLMMSPRKVRRVIELVKGKPIEEALTILKFTNKAAAIPLMKTIQSAAANAMAIEGTARLKAEDLAIKQVYVDEGPRAKRIQFRAMGRVYRYKKRFAHLTVVVEGEPEEETPTRKKRARAKKAAKPTPARSKTDKKDVTKKSGGGKKTTVKKTSKTKSTTKKSSAQKTAAKKSETGKTTAGKSGAPKTGSGKKTAKKSGAEKKKDEK